ncbi:MAG: hypothetical protein VB054_04905 [Petrimonas sp.]|nr:hypothetical protein [Petrimonas sp.]
MKKVKLSTLGSLIDRTNEVPARKLNYLFSQQGWYRIIDCGIYGSTGIISMINIFNTSVPKAITFQYAISYGAPLFVSKISPDSSYFTKARTLTKSGERSFLEVFYSIGTENQTAIMLSACPYPDLVAGVIPGNIPDGYIATEYNL